MSQFPQWYPTGAHGIVRVPSGWDVLKLGGIAFNCRAKITAGDLGLRVDAKEKKGATASLLSVHGLGQTTWTAQLAVWTVEQMIDVDDALPLVFSVTNPQPVSLDHPATYTQARLLGKLDVLVRNVSPWIRSSEIKGGYEVHLSLQHWPAAVKGARTNKSVTPARPAVLPGLQAQQQQRKKQAALNPPPTSSPTYGAAPKP